jgi:hypothetical protein
VNLIISIIYVGIERGEVPVTSQIDFDQLLDSLRREVEDGVVGSYSCVVDKDGGGAELFSDFVCGSINCVRVGDVALYIMGDDYLSVSCLVETAANGIKGKSLPT